MALEAIKLILKIAIDTFLNLGKAILNGLWEGIKFIWDSIVKWFNNSVNGLVDWFNGLKSAFTNIGKNLFQGLWDGLKSIWSSISSWISDTVSWITDKLAFWNSSKSKMSSNDVKSPTIPKYDMGTPFVPNDQLAFIHKGEMIVPAKYNPYNYNNNSGANPAGEISIDASINIEGSVDKSFMSQLKQAQNNQINKIKNLYNPTVTRAMI